MNSLGKYVLTKTQKIVLLVVVFALIAGGYYAGFYLPVQRRIEAADTAELDAQIQLEQMKAMQIRQMEEEIEENKTSNAPMVPAYNHFKTETEELNRIFANAYDFTFQYSEPQVDGMEIRRAMNISFTADSFDHAVSMLHEVVEGPYRCLIVDIYRNNEYRKLADRDDASEEEMAYKDFTLSVKKAGTSGNTIGPLKTSVRLWMTDHYKIKAVISDTVTADDKKEERCEKRLELEAAHSSESEMVTVEVKVKGDDGDSDDDDSYTITTTTIITTIRWQNGTIEKELLQNDK